MKLAKWVSVTGGMAALAIATGTVVAQRPPDSSAAAKASHPWMNTSLSPDERAEMVLKQLTMQEKLDLLHGEGMPHWQHMSSSIIAVQEQSNGGAGFVLGVPRLGIPPIQMSDAAYGVRGSADNGRYSTALPSNLGSAASWDPEQACAYGALIGKELRMQGYNMTLGGGTNLTRDPRNGRTFEYMGEDPVLAGTLVGQRIRCEGNQHVISDIKHYAVNDQESGRTEVDVQIGERALRESDLLAFQIGIGYGHPNAVMCSYNGVNGKYACQNPFLLTEVLKKEWQFPGFVVSDWGGTHSTVEASAAGLDQEQPLDTFYGAPLGAAVKSGKVPMAQLDDHVRRVLRSEFASGIVDDPIHKGVVDVQGGFDTAQKAEEAGAVLLRNENAALPLSRDLKTIAVIGKNADTGMISGGGSAQVDPPGHLSGGPWQQKVWFPTSPMKAIQAKLGSNAKVSFASGEDIAEAVKAAKAADVAVVFAWQWESEGMDLPNLSLPENQDALIAAVTKANPHTIVVLETGTAVTMPWLESTAGVLEAWYGGSKGADAVANLLFGDVNPSGKLPMTFPRSEADLPHPTLVHPPKAGGKAAYNPEGALTFKVNYDEGLKVGYKWYDAESKPVLFPFGFGLSYTSFAYSDFNVSSDGSSVTLKVKNTGQRAGEEIAEVYAAPPASAGEPPKRLVGFDKVKLQPGEEREVTVAIPAHYLEIWDEASKKWMRPAGEWGFMAGGSSADLPLKRNLQLR